MLKRTLPFFTLLLLALALVIPGGALPAGADDEEAQEEALVTRLFDVGALTRGREDFFRTLSMSAEPGAEDEQPLFGSEAEEPIYPLGQIDELIELVKAHVRPGSWESTLGAQMSSIGEQTLLVRNFKDVVDAVGVHLGALQRRMMRRVHVDVETFHLTSAELQGLLQDGSAVLAKPDRLEALRGGEQAGPSVSIAAYERNRAAIFSGTQRAYVGDYDVEVAWGANISDPIVYVDNAGLAADVRAILGPDGKTAIVAVGAALSELLQLDALDTGEKRIIELPQNAVTRIQSRVQLPVGAWALLEGQSSDGGDRRWTFAIRVSALPTEDLARTARGAELTAPAARPSRSFELRSFDVGMLTHAVQSMMGESLFLTPSNFTPPEPPELPEPSPILPQDSIVELIRQTIVPGSWELNGTGIEARNGHIYARNAPDVLAAVGQRLDTLRRELIYSTVTTAEIVDVPYALGRQLQAAPDRVLNDAARLALQAAFKTGDAKSLGATRVAAMRGARNAVTGGRRTAYVADYEVEIAGESVIANPVIQRSLSGTGLDVLPQLTPGGQAADTTLRFVRTDVQRPLRTVDTPHGKLSVPEMDMFRLRSALQVPLGKTMIVGSTGDKGRRRLLLVTTRLRRAAR